MECRILKSKNCAITWEYGNGHDGVDITGFQNDTHVLDYIVSHSDGVVTEVINTETLNTPNNLNNPGNMVKIDHGNGYFTRYLHLSYGTVEVKPGDKVKAGQVLGYMGNTGYSFGGHLHFEVWKNGTRIAPTNYLSEDLPISAESTETLKYIIGDVVDINGVYVSSSSDNKLIPVLTRGTITKVIDGARNPYLLDNGNIGWVNDNCIVKDDIKYLSNKNYKGTSIVDAFNQIKVDSSYNYRSRLANANDITNYSGTAEQNTIMLEMLKNGTLKSV